jgi:hypothetical protein
LFKPEKDTLKLNASWSSMIRAKSKKSMGLGESRLGNQKRMLRLIKIFLVFGLSCSYSFPKYDLHCFR